MTDPERIFGAGGAIEALVQAKKGGQIRYIGIYPGIKVRISI